MIIVADGILAMWIYLNMGICYPLRNGNLDGKRYDKPSKFQGSLIGQSGCGDGTASEWNIFPEGPQPGVYKFDYSVENVRQLGAHGISAVRLPINVSSVRDPTCLQPPDVSMGAAPLTYFSYGLI